MFARFSIALASPARCFRHFFHRGNFLKSAVEIRMPSLSPTMTQGNIVKWHKKEGDTVAPGELLCEIQTDKAVLGFEVEEEGTLAKILKGDNSSNVSVGALIALIAEGDTDWRSVQIPTEVATESLDISAQSSGTTAEKSKSSHVLGPAVKILLERFNIDPSKVESTGPRGILLKGDLLKYIKVKDLKPVEVVEKPVAPDLGASQMNKKFEKVETHPQQSVQPSQVPHTTQQKTLSKMSIPHFYTSVNVCMDGIQKCYEEFKSDKVDVSYLDILIKAAAITLQKHPHLNVPSDDQGGRPSNGINISYRAEIGGASVVQEIKDVASMTVEQISIINKNLKEKADQNPEMSSSSLLIHYNDNVDITSFLSIVLPPYVACLSITAPRLVLDGDCSEIFLSSVSLSVDSTVVGDVEAVNYLESLKELIENPSLLISHFPNQVDVGKLFAK